MAHPMPRWRNSGWTAPSISAWYSPERMNQCAVPMPTLRSPRPAAVRLAGEDVSLALDIAGLADELLVRCQVTPVQTAVGQGGTDRTAWLGPMGAVREAALAGQVQDIGERTREPVLVQQANLA